MSHTFDRNVSSGELFSLPFPGSLKGNKHPPIGFNRSTMLTMDLDRKKAEIDKIETRLH